MKYGDNILTVSQPLLPGMEAVYNGVDFDLAKGNGDNADGLAVATGGIMRTLAEGAVFNGTSWDRVRGAGDQADALVTLSGGLPRGITEPFVFNGTSYDRLRNNNDVQIAASSARTVSGDSGDQTNFNARGLKLFINVSAVSGTTPSMTITIQGKDVTSGVYYNILSGVAITAAGTQLLEVYPGLTASANAVANDILPRTFKVAWAITGTTPSFTFSIGASEIV